MTFKLSCSGVSINDAELFGVMTGDINRSRNGLGLIGLNEPLKLADQA
jgi:hypothetical protein